MGYNPSYRTEARIYAKHILATKPDARIGVLYQNDDLGKDYLIGLKDGLGLDHAGMIVKEVSYEVSEPTVDAQIITLQGASVDVLLIAATAKAGAQAIRKSFDLGWNATRYISLSSSSIAILKTASLEKSKGLITAGAYVEVADTRFKELPDMREWLAFTSKYMSALEYSNSVAAYGFGAAATMVQVLRQCGNDLSRENIMRQAANLKDFHAPLLVRGVTINTSPTNYSPIRQLQLATFNGEGWDPIGDVLSD
jgi:branched-chain amino acid transport system substrate-binding protein